jgi:uncharacterized membrane protein
VATAEAKNSRAMVSTYLVIKFVHIVSSTLIFGGGLATAIYLFAAYRNGRPEMLKTMAGHVVVADWLIMAPAVLVQFATGLWLTDYLNIPFRSAWFVSVFVMFGAAGICWAPALWIQFELSYLEHHDHALTVPERYRKLMRIWVGLAVPAFVLTLALFAMMVFKFGVATRLI